jgi:hypothetical protein
MIYQFQSEDGEIIEREYSMSSPQAAGKGITVKGKKYKRILTSGAHAPEVNSGFKAYVSVAAPKGLDKIDPSIPIDRKTGRPVITNHRQEKEVARLTGKEWL